jgi:hypothetical protein
MILVIVIGKSAKPLNGIQIHVFRLKELFFTKNKNLFKNDSITMAYFF